MNMKEMTQHDIEAIQEKTRLLQRMTDLILNDILTLYRSGQYIELNQNEKKWQPNNDRIPVWLIWWQGEDAMPDLVKVCYASLQKALPDELCEIHLITQENLEEYISLPEWVVEKFNAGAITITHLSDILRMALLDNYSGLYLDATYLFTEKIEPYSFTDTAFFTLCDRDKDWFDLVQGRWSGNFFYLRPDTYGGTSDVARLFVKYMKNAFYYYWASQDKLTDYYLIDYVIDEAYRSFPQVQSLLDSIPDTNPQVADLIFSLNEKYTPERFSGFTRDTSVFKLSNRIPLSENTESGEPTIIGYLLENKKDLCQG